jgi:hypothetical protein
MFRTLIVFAAALSLFGCSARQAPVGVGDEPDTTVNHHRSVDSTDYFPLAIGNWWVYRDGSRVLNVRVVDSLAVDDRTLFVVTHQWGPAPDVVDTVLLRYGASNRIYIASRDNPVDDVLYLDAALPLGDSSIPGAVVSSKGLTHAIGLRSFVDCFEVARFDGEADVRIYAPALGMIIWERFRTRYELVAANIGGNTVP